MSRRRPCHLQKHSECREPDQRAMRWVHGRGSGDETWVSPCRGTSAAAREAWPKGSVPMPTAARPSGPAHVAPIPTPSIKRCLDATVQAADRLDDWIRQYVVEHPLRYRPTEFLADRPQPAGRQKPFPPFSRVSAPHAVGRSRMQAPSRNGLVLARNRSVWLSAIGKSLKGEYDAAATPLPGHLAALVNQLETQEQG